MSKTIICNKCGKQFDFWDTQENFDIHTVCGYGSKFDGEEIELDLCCSCFDKLVEECAISPLKKNEREAIISLRGLQYGFRELDSDSEAEKAVQEVFSI